MDRDDEKVMKGIEDLRSEVRELRETVNVLVDIIVNMETMEDPQLEVEGNMMGYDSALKSGKYCM